MPKEIERKFLVRSDAWRRSAASARRIRQGYLSTDPDRVVRVRLADGMRGWLTVKGRTRGATRDEFEYEIPAVDAAWILDHLAARFIDKTRHVVEHAGRRWEVDEFHGANAGLVLAELELSDEDEPFEAPPWLGQEVTGEPRYSNLALSEPGPRGA